MPERIYLLAFMGLLGTYSMSLAIGDSGYPTWKRYVLVACGLLFPAGAVWSTLKVMTINQAAGMAWEWAAVLPIGWLVLCGSVLAAISPLMALATTIHIHYRPYSNNRSR